MAFAPVLGRLLRCAGVLGAVALTALVLTYEPEIPGPRVQREPERKALVAAPEPAAARSPVSASREPASVAAPRTSSLSTGGASFAAAPASPAATPIAELPPPDFELIAAAFTANGDDRPAMGDQLAEWMDKVNWRDPAQHATMKSIISKVYAEHQVARDIIEPYLEREYFKQLEQTPDDPRAARQAVDTYFSIVDDPLAQRRFLLTLRRENADPAGIPYYDGIYVRLFGRGPTYEELQPPKILPAEDSAEAQPDAPSESAFDEKS